jgi:nucleoside-diphosphate-sugar epimerase
MDLIIGCGYVGERVADMLHEQRHEVIGVTHSSDSAGRLSAAKPYKIQACDVSDRASVQQLTFRLSGPPDTIIHCASSNRGGADAYRKVYLEGCAYLLQCFPTARILFTSSSSVYPQTDGSVVTEDSDASPDRETSRLLREAEDLVLLIGGCVARLAGIYGPGRSFVLKNFLEGTASIEGNHGDGRCLNQIHREDAAAALVHLVTTRQRGIFNVVDDVPMTQRECFTVLSRRFAKSLPSVAEPDMNRKRAWTNKRLSNTKLRATGWVPRYRSYFEALDRDPELVPSILAQVGTMRDS